MQLWAGEIAPGTDEAGRYSGHLSLIQAVTKDGSRRRTITVLEADPMITMSRSLVESLMLKVPVRLLDMLRVETPEGPLVYVVRGIDTDTGVYYLSWPD